VVLEINFFALLHTVRRQWVSFAAVVVLSVFLAIIYLNRTEPVYTVSLDLAPVTPVSGGSAGGLGTLGAIAGISLDRNGGGSFKLFTVGLQSYTVAEALARRPGLLQRMYPKEWSGHDWMQPDSVLVSVVRAVKGVLGLPVTPWKAPGPDRIYQYLLDSLIVDVNLDRPTITLRILTAKPALGAEFLMTLQHETDEILRRRALDRSNRYVEYLSHELQTVTVAEYRQTLTQNLAEQEKTKMMASSNISYAAEIFSGPMISDRPTWPRAPLVLLFALVMGSLAGVVAGLLLDFLGWRLSLRPFGFRPLPSKA
jgi:hypothetical protein